MFTVDFAGAEPMLLAPEEWGEWLITLKCYVLFSCGCWSCVLFPVEFIKALAASFSQGQDYSTYCHRFPEAVGTGAAQPALRLAWQASVSSATVLSRRDARALHGIYRARTTPCFRFFHVRHLSTRGFRTRLAPQPVASTLVSSRPPPAPSNHQPASCLHRAADLDTSCGWSYPNRRLWLFSRCIGA